MKWIKQPLTSQVAYQLDMGGHVKLENIRTIVTAGVQHAIVTLKNDRKHWHRWFWDIDNDRWQNQGEFTTYTAAKESADVHEVDLVSIARQDAIDNTAGTAGASAVVLAQWAVEPYRNEARSDRFMTVACATPYTTGVITEIFKRLGCTVETREPEPELVP